MRRFLAVLIVLSLFIAGCTDGDEDQAVDLPTSTESSTTTTTPSPAETQEPQEEERRLRVLGHQDFRRSGFNGDVWALGDFAYVGTYGGKTEDADCPQTGVKVVDISDPREPRFVSRLRTAPATTAEDVVVRTVDTNAFRGDVAVVGLQACNVDEGPQPQTFRGLQFFDVTDPRKPQTLSRWELPGDPAGCHEIDFVSRGPRVLAGCAAPFGKEVGIDEAFVVDVSNPRSPREAFSWSLDVGPGGGVGCLPAQIVHNLRFSRDARTLYVSYWDAGTPILDITKLREPKMLGRVEPVPLDPDGDNHSVAEIPGGLLIVLHEDFSPALPAANFGGCGTRFGAWGPLRIYDIKNPAKPKLVSEFTTKNMKIANMKTPEIFTVHNAEVVGDDEAMVSWYSDGIRWLDLSRPDKPREVDAWIPPAAADPHGFNPKIALVWGVYPLPERDLVLATDLNSGLWVLEAPGLGDRP